MNDMMDQIAAAQAVLEDSVSFMADGGDVDRGSPPKSGLVVAALGNEGEVYYGEPGSLHNSLRYYGDFEDEAMGFAGPDGKFMTREEAYEAITGKAGAIEPFTGSQMALDSADLNHEGDLRYPQLHDVDDVGKEPRQMAEGGEVPSNPPSVAKHEPFHPFASAAVLGTSAALMGAGASLFGLQEFFGANLTSFDTAAMIGFGSAALGAGSIAMKNAVSGVMNVARDKEQRPVMEEVAEDAAAHARRPKRYTDGGDVDETQDYYANSEKTPYVNKELIDFYDLHFFDDAEHERLRRLSEKLDRSPFLEELNDRGMAGGGDVPVMLEPGEKITPPGDDDEWEVPSPIGKPDDGDIFPAMLEPGTHVTPKDQVKTERTLPHMAGGGDVGMANERFNDDFEAMQSGPLGSKNTMALADAIKKLTETVTKAVAAMEKSERKQSPAPTDGTKVRSTTFDPAKAKERFGKPPGGTGHTSAEGLAAYARSQAARQTRAT
jgi:hypothetical protein